MKKHLIILLAAIMFIIFIASCGQQNNKKHEQQPTIPIIDDKEGRIEEADREPLLQEQTENIEKGMYSNEIYELLGNPHLIRGSAISMRHEQLAYYELSDGRVLEIIYVGENVADESGEALRKIWKVDSFEYITLEEFQKIKD